MNGPKQFREGDFMKNVFAIMISTCGIVSAVAAQSWFSQITASQKAVIQQQSLRGISFASPDSGVAVGTQGLILRTVNGGAAWTYSFDTSYTTLNGVNCPSSSICYAVGSYGKIIKTTDAGQTWTPQTSFIKTVGLFSVDCPSTTTCYIGYGSPGLSSTTFLKTTNGGTTWSTQNAPSWGYELNAINCPTATNCYVGGESRAVRKTADGSIWTTPTSPPAPASAASANLPIRGIYCTDALTCYVVGGGGMLAKTTDGMGTWTSENSGTKLSLRSIYFADASTGYASGDSGVILKTTNGGSAWTKENSGTTAGLSGIVFASPTTGYAVGEGGTVLKWGTPTTSIFHANQSLPSRIGKARENTRNFGANGRLVAPAGKFGKARTDGLINGPGIEFDGLNMIGSAPW